MANHLCIYNVLVDLPVAMTNVQVAGAIAYAVKRACLAAGYPTAALVSIQNIYPGGSVANPQWDGYQLMQHAINVVLPTTLTSPQVEQFLAGAIASNFAAAGQPGNVSVTLTGTNPIPTVSSPSPPIDIMTTFPCIGLMSSQAVGSAGVVMVSEQVGSDITSQLIGAQVASKLGSVSAAIS